MGQRITIYCDGCGFAIGGTPTMRKGDNVLTEGDNIVSGADLCSDCWRVITQSLRAGLTIHPMTEEEKAKYFPWEST